MTSRFAKWLGATATFVAAIAAPQSQAAAQPWPVQPIRVVVPYPPGGANDIVARVYCNALQGELGQPFLVENRAGAGGEIGAQSVAKSPPDGYTMLFGAIGSLAIHAAIPTQHPPYELSKAFVGVSMAASVPLALAIRRGLAASDVQTLLSLARTRPHGLTYGSAGNGSTQHLTTEYFQQQAKVSFIHIPYKGSAPAINDLLGGQIDFVIETIPALSAQLSSDRLKVLAVTTAKRSPSLPDTPTLNEAGVRGFDVSTMYGLLAPRGTPPEIVKRLSAAMQSVGAKPEVKYLLAKQGADIKTSSREETDALIKGEIEKWSRVAEAADIK